MMTNVADDAARPDGDVAGHQLGGQRVEIGVHLCQQLGARKGIDDQRRQAEDEAEEHRIDQQQAGMNGQKSAMTPREGRSRFPAQCG